MERTAVEGRVVFLPWVTLPKAVRIGGFRFSPINVGNPTPVVGETIAGTLSKALACYVDQAGKPIENCTILLRARHREGWNIPESQWSRAWMAADLLSLVCLAEQRFLEGHFSPHMNATMFRPIAQGISAGSSSISTFHRRRGSSLRIGGLKFEDVLFQCPPHVERTACETVNVQLAKALDRARRSKAPVWDAVSSSLPLFLLGHGETPELNWETCVMLSAIAFERLLEPQQSSALEISKCFAQLWDGHVGVVIKQATRVRADHDPQYAADQQLWPLHRKWMKELYESRSSLAHRGPRAKFRSNWTPAQNIVIAAFVYPLAVKLKLAQTSLYKLTNSELGACDALDHLLDSDWGRGWRKPPEWPSLLSEWETRRDLREIIARALRAG